ncbi:MAG: AsmA-like C-terminal domain-containing protein [Minwuia sp.]|nr:AsmA-like C-terminal domain-containing protein [Minwuia sp.]
MAFVGAIFAVSTTAGILAAWRLSEGPVALGFMTPWLQERIGDLPNGKTLSFTSVQVVWDGESGALDLEVLDASLASADGTQVASVPEAALSFDGASLLEGQVRLRTVKLKGLNLDIRRNPDGGLELGLAGSDDDVGSADSTLRPLNELLDELFASGDDDDGPLSRLSRIVIRDSQIVMNDVARGRFFLLSVDQIAVSAASRSVLVEGEMVLDAEQLKLPLDVGLVINRETGFTLANIDFEPFLIPEMTMALSGPDQLLGFQFPVSGRISVQLDAQGTAEKVRLELSARRGQIALPGILAAPVPIVSAELKGTFDPASSVLSVDRLDYDSGVVQARASGRVEITDAGPDLDIVIEGDDLPVVLIPAYWPVDRAAGVRNWIEAHLLDGRADQVRARLDMRPEFWSLKVPPEASLDVRLSFHDARVRLYEPYDDITGGQGTVAVTGRTLNVSMDQGRSAGLTLSDGVLKIDDFGKARPLLTTEFVGEGTIAASVAASVRGALARSVGGPPDVSGMSGDAATRVRLSLPVASDTRLDEIDIAAASHVRNVTAQGLYGGMSFTAEALALRVDAERLAVEGAGELNNVPMALRWIQEFRPDDGFGQHFSVGGRVDPESLARLGVDVPDWITGAVGVRSDIHVKDDGVVAATVDLDLTPTGLEPPGGFWLKVPGTAARAGFQVLRTPSNVLRLDGLEIVAPDLIFRGALSGTVANGLENMEVELLQLGQDRLSGQLRRLDGERWGLDVAAESLNAEPLVAILRESTSDEPSHLNLEAAFTFGQLRLDPAVTVANASGQLTLIDGQLARLETTGLVAGTEPLSISVKPQQPGTAVGVGTRDLLVESGDAGAMLSVLDLTDALQGGKLMITASIAPDGQATGLLGIDNFRLTETPTGARLLSLASLTGIGQAMSGEGLGFVRADIPFGYDGTRMNFKGARATGPALGITADGYIDRDLEEIRLVGNVIPAYSLTRVLGAIPLIGTILGGDDGIFGVTYLIEGPAAKPTITVNPLSALAPGILRRMFLEPVDPSQRPEVFAPPVNDR